MPFESQAQRGFMYSQHPDLAREFEAATPKGKKLPEHVKHEDSLIPKWANYRPATQPGVSCATCDFYVAGRCEMFEYARVEDDFTCDRWEGDLEKADAPMYTTTPEVEHVNPFTLPDLLNSIEPVINVHVRDLTKGQAHGAEFHLRVHGMSAMPDGKRTYRMVTRDGHYVGRTNPTHSKAVKGDILKVQANDFLQDANGDVRWMNANVVSGYSDTAHSWKELCAIAGGDLLKDEADGPAGDIPAAGDEGNQVDALQGDVAALSAVTGPTISDVHVNVPLRNISVGYMNKRLPYQVKKADKHRQLIYGVVLEPNSLDSQDDFMLPKHVESAAHTYMRKVAKGKSSVSKIQHRTKGFFKDKPSVVPVESYIAPVDFSYDGKEMVKKGTWVMVLHIEDPAIWSDVLAGKFTGLSIGGTGIRRSISQAGVDIPQSEWPWA